MQDSAPMKHAPNFEPTRPMWVDALLSALRTVLGLFFIFWLLSLVPEESDPRVSIPLVLLLIGAVIYAIVLRLQFKRVVNSKRPGLVAAESLILSAGLFIAIFSAIYVILEGDNPGSFSQPIDHFTAAYFTLTVLATVGFGDITAVSNTARLIVMAQMALGLGFLAVIIKVSTSAAQRAIQSRGSSREPRDDGEGGA